MAISLGRRPGSSPTRRIACPLAVASALVVLAACNGESTATGDGGFDSVTLQYANPVAEADAQAFAGTVGPWSELVAEKTDGAFAIDAAHGGSLLSHPDMPRGISDGLTDLGSVQLSIDPSTFPLWSISGLHDPGIGTELSAFQQTMITRLMLEKVPALQEELDEANMTMLFSIASSPHHLITRDEISGLDDLRGKDIRTYGEFMPKLFESVGANPVSMPPDEAYTGLDRGVVDGAFSLPAAFVTLGWYEVTKQVTTVGNGTTPPLNAGFQLAINTDTWDGLPDNTKLAMLEAAREVEREYAAEKVPELESEALTTMEEAGLTVTEMSAEDVAAWSEAYPDVWTEFADRMDDEGLPGTEFVEAYLELAALDPAELEAQYDAQWESILDEYR